MTGHWLRLLVSCPGSAVTGFKGLFTSNYSDWKKGTENELSNLLYRVPSVVTVHLLIKLSYCKQWKSGIQETTWMLLATFAFFFTKAAIIINESLSDYGNALLW